MSKVQKKKKKEEEEEKEEKEKEKKKKKKKKQKKKKIVPVYNCMHVQSCNLSIYISLFLYIKTK
jgi:cadmium resistance protein CadD (predicted permease)